MDVYAISDLAKHKDSCILEIHEDIDLGIEDAPFLLQFFNYAHLPSHLQAISKPFAQTAITILQTTKRNPEQTMALRKLLEAKDCAVRSAVAK